MKKKRYIIVSVTSINLNSKTISFLFVFMVVFLNTGLSSQNISDDIKIIRIAEEASWPPFTYEKSGKAETGLAFELMTEIFSSTDIRINMDLFPQKRMLSYLKTGEYDVVSVISKCKEREKYLDYSVPLFEDKKMVYYSSAKISNFNWNSYIDFKNYKIGITRGTNYSDDFSRAVNEYNLDIDEVTSNLQNFQKLNAGRVDLVIMNQSTASELFRINNEFKKNIRKAEKPVSVFNYHMAFSRNSPRKIIKNEINEIILGLQEKGVIQKIAEKYISVE